MLTFSFDTFIWNILGLSKLSIKTFRYILMFLIDDFINVEINFFLQEDQLLDGLAIQTVYDLVDVFH